MRIKPLPPMNSLIVFEAAARHLSFTKAADERAEAERLFEAAGRNVKQAINQHHG